MARQLDFKMVLLTVLTWWCTPAFACVGPHLNTSTFLDRPPAVGNYDVVAEVEVIELLNPWTPRGYPPDLRYATQVSVRVVAPIKGVTSGQILAVDTGGTSCDQILKREDVGLRAFIAGSIHVNENGVGTFRGKHPWVTR